MANIQRTEQWTTAASRFRLDKTELMWTDTKARVTRPVTTAVKRQRPS